MPTATIDLLKTLEWVKRFNFNRNSALGNTLEPAITNANTVLQTILGAPFAWRWNRVVTGFITIPGQQDYYLFNWAPITTIKLGWMTVDQNGMCQTVSQAGFTGGMFPNFNNTLGGLTTDGTVIWTNLGSIGVPISETYSFGWIETSSVQDMTNGKWIEMESQICLGIGSEMSRPKFIAAQGDDGTGNITFRFLPVPDDNYPVAITLQERPPLFTQLGQTWSPIPDEYSHIYSWGFLSLMFLFADDPRFTLANQKFVTQLLAASEGLSETQRNALLGNWQYVTGQPVNNANRMTQGEQSRGV